MKDWLIRSMPTLEEFLWTDDDQDYEFATLSEDFIPFLAKNQFKSQVRKLAPQMKRSATKGEIQDKIAMILNPTQVKINKDFVKVQL